MDGTTTTTSGGAGEEQWVADAPTTEQPQLLATAVGDQCAACRARLAGDQRYCVECGERRGKPRYAMPGSGASSSSHAARSGSRRQRRSLTGSGALIGGIGVLLIAMGVGVLIGRTSNSASPRTGGVQVVTVAGGAAGAAASTTPTTSSTPASTAAKPGSKSSISASKSKGKGAAAALATKLPAKAKVIPKNLKSKVAKVGGACSGGPGCHGGKFTGGFFGP